MAVRLFNVNDTPNLKGTLEAVIARFSVLFPKAKVVAVTREGGGNPRMGLLLIGITPSITKFTQSVTQFLPYTTPKESLEDKNFNSSNPISSNSGEENQKDDDSTIYPYQHSSQSSVVPSKMGDPAPQLGEVLSDAIIPPPKTEPELVIIGNRDRKKIEPKELNSPTPQIASKQLVRISNKRHPSKGLRLKIIAVGAKYLLCEVLQGSRKGEQWYMLLSEVSE